MCVCVRVCVCARQLSPSVIQHKILLNAHAIAIFDLIVARQAVLVGSGSEALLALLSLMGLVWPCQEGCVCRWMQMAL